MNYNNTQTAQVMNAEVGPMVSVSPEEIGARIDRLPSSKFVWRMVVLLSLGAFFEFYELFSTAYLLPGIVKAGILTTTTQNFFDFTGSAGYIASTFIGLLLGVMAFGTVADKFGRKMIFTYALLGYSFSAFMMGLQSDPYWLNFWRLMTGIGLGVELVTIDAYLSELAPARLRGRAFAVSKIIAFSAVPTVAFLSYLLVPIEWFEIDGWRWVVFFGASGACLVWYLRRELPESARWLASNGQLDEANRVVAEMEAKVEKETGKPLPKPIKVVESVVQETGADKASFWELWGPEYRSRTIMLMIFHVAQAIGIYGFSNWMPTLLVENGVEISESLKYGVIVALLTPLGPLLAISFADRIERKWQITISAVIMAIAGMLFADATSSVVVLILSALIVIGGTVIALAFHTYQAELFPTRIRSMGISLVYSMSRISGAMSGFLIAASLKANGVSGALMLITACMIIVAIVIGGFGPKTRGRSLEDISH